ncbi:MAG TPA: hypothetical protein VJ901_15065 [Thermoanaerobaculia bacterium]|nr:hypothetical protein [Thermoanaerobaculia bacterium]
MRSILIGCLVAVSIAPVSNAARRRATAPPSAQQPSGNCHTFGLVAAGTQASYLTTTSNGNVTFTITWISDTPTQTKTTQHVVTPQATTDVETTLDGVVSGNLRGLKHLYTKSTTAVPFLGNTIVEVDIDFVPALIAGPSAGWCTNETWSVPATTETIVSKSLAGQQSSIVTTIASAGQVLAVGESVTVPAGTFQTVKYKSSIVSGNSVQPAITWTDMSRSIVVKQDTLDSAGNVTTSTQLTSVQP